MTVITCINDFQKLAEQKVPRMFYDYTDSGAYTENTYKNNSNAFQKYKIRQRVCVNIENRNLKTKMIGREIAMPMALAPVGMSGMQHANGEILAAKVAKEFGIPFTLSTMSVCPIESIAKETEHPFWFQLYLMRDREFSADIIQRAKNANCEALVMTLDLQILAQRHKDIKNGLTTPPKLTIKNIINMASKPKWCWNMMKTKHKTFGNIVGYAKGVNDLGNFAEWTRGQFDLTLDWSAVEWVKERWGKKLILKGINDVEDAKIASELGVDAIVISNHGGRQLDGAPAPIDMIAPIVDAVGDKVEVHMDSGIRTGQDIFKAIAMGAKSTYVGRAYVFALGAMGEKGVRKAIEILYNELDTTMALAGETDIQKVGRHNILGQN